MKLPPFRIERFFAEWEFAVPYPLSASDVDGIPLAELLALADDEGRAAWDGLALGYTETNGHPRLRAEIAGIYDTVTEDDVLVFSGAEEAIFVLMNVLGGAGRELVLQWPSYQSFDSVARGAAARVRRLELLFEEGWAVDPDRLAGLLTPDTSAVVVNFPHNPTGALPGRDLFEEILRLTEERGARLVSDEVYRLLEHDPAGRLPAAADLSPRAVSMGVMSKSFGLAGLRIGWVATRDRALLERLVAFKDYLTICNSAPSEILAIIALGARDAILERSRRLLRGGLAAAESFMERRSEVVEWVPPLAGGIGFPRFRKGVDIDVDRLAESVAVSQGVVMLPGSVFDRPRHFRLGMTRPQFPEALERFESALESLER